MAEYTSQLLESDGRRPNWAKMEVQCDTQINVIFVINGVDLKSEYKSLLSYFWEI